MKIGVQTFTVRKLMNKNLAQTLDVLKRIGVNYLEVTRIKFNNQNAYIIKKSNLKVVSIQLTLKKLVNEFDSIIEFCRIVDCKNVVVSVLSLKAIIGGERPLKKFCNQLNETALKYNQHDITLAFHHHDFEFKKINDGNKLDYILRNTNNLVKIVTDTYWTKKSNIEPDQLIEQLEDRLIGVHLRDLAKNHRDDCEIGSGKIDFDKVLSKAKNVYFVIEQNTKSPIKSLGLSIMYLKSKNLK